MLEVKPSHLLLLGVASIFTTGCGHLVAQPAPAPVAVMVKPLRVSEPTSLIMPAPQPVVLATKNVKARPLPKVVVPKGTHTHRYGVKCKPVRHTHAYRVLQHRHRYGCVPQVKHKDARVLRQPALPTVRPKGEYKGPIKLDAKLLKQYHQ